MASTFLGLLFFLICSVIWALISGLRALIRCLKSCTGTGQSEERVDSFQEPRRSLAVRWQTERQLCDRARALSAQGLLFARGEELCGPEALTAARSNGYIALDIETTGPEPEINRITAMHAAYFDGAQITASRYFQANVTFDKRALRNALLDFFCTFRTAIDGTTPLCVYDSELTMCFLLDAIAACNFAVTLHYINVRALAKKMLPNAPSCELLALRKLLWLPRVVAPVGTAGAAACGQLLARLMVSPAANIIPECGIVDARPQGLGFWNVARIKACFIAFDVETTGLDPIFDRIIEIGAVIFQNGRVYRTFSSLVNPGFPIPASASAINGITQPMLDEAPTEAELYPRLIDFLGTAVQGETIMCAHNAKFDFDFFGNTLTRLGFNANIVYIDTLRLAKRCLHGLPNYKQATIENHFGLANPSAHRAAADAENCGRILLHLAEEASETLEAERRQHEAARPDPQEMEVCAFIQDVISKRGGDTRKLRFKRGSNGYVYACCCFTFAKFRFAKAGRYILVKRSCPEALCLVNTPCAKSEGGADYIRVYFSSPFDLEPLTAYIYDVFADCCASRERYIGDSEHCRQAANDSDLAMYALRDDEVTALLREAKERCYPSIAYVEREQKRAQQAAEAEKRRTERELRKAEKNERLAVASAQKLPRGRAVAQIDEAGTCIKEFESIAAASRETGINAKCIREAAKGTQKHAGGYRWKYAENATVTPKG